MVQKNSLKYNCVIIIGPTACGKTAVSVELAKHMSGEIISADSLQIYRKLDIGTAKVTEDEMQGVKHYMIDVVEPTDIFSVSQYREMAEKCFNEIISDSKIPIIVGGTGLYIKSLLYNNNYGNCSGNAEIRKKYNLLLEKYGKEYVYDILSKIDPVSANKLHINDTKRVVRAIEIYESTGKTKSQLELENKTSLNNELIKPLIIGLNLSSRDNLYNKIDRRVDMMFDNGLEQEVQALLSSGITFHNQAMQAIGYREFEQYVDGQIDLNQLKELIKLNTRHYAKRQLTFFNQIPINNWYNTDTQSIDDIVKDIIKKFYE